MRNIVLLAALVGLSACASSGAGLAATAVDAEHTSTKPPQALALCINDAMNGMVQMIDAGQSHYVVTRNNGYGRPMVRWDIYPKDAGSRMEVRKSFGLMSGEDKARACL